MNIIPFLDLKRENDRYAAEIKEAVNKVLDSGWYILGKEKVAFEDTFAQYCGTDHCIGVGNGLDALRLILEGYKKLHKLKVGDEAILPTNSFVATALAVSESGLIPVFADCSSDTYNIDPISVESKMTSRVKAIIVVHLYGQVAPIEELRRISEKYNILLIEDAAQAHGAKHKGYRAGSLGDAAAFSFYPVKNMGGLGDGGAITTNDGQLSNLIYSLSNYGEKEKYQHQYKGFNSRLDEIQAAVLSVKLKHLEDDNAKRRQIANIYYQYIKNENVTLPKMVDMGEHVFHQYVVRCKDRNRLKTYLSDRGIQTQIHYPVPIHKQTAYEEYGGVVLPVSEQVQQEILSLPMYPSMTSDELTRIVKVINSWK